MMFLKVCDPGVTDLFRSVPLQIKTNEIVIFYENRN